MGKRDYTHNFRLLYGDSRRPEYPKNLIDLDEEILLVIDRIRASSALPPMERALATTGAHEQLRVLEMTRFKIIQSLKDA